MARRKKSWTDYPPEYAEVAKLVATETLPVALGPFTFVEANTARQSWYRFRTDLAGALAGKRDGSYPSRLYEMIESLAAHVEMDSNDSQQFNVVFRMDPLVRVMRELNPAARQVHELAKAHFAAAQRPGNVSSPIYTNDEMLERIQSIKTTKNDFSC